MSRYKMGKIQAKKNNSYSLINCVSGYYYDCTTFKTLTLKSSN